jgi:hypothetical protein
MRDDIQSDFMVFLAEGQEGIGAVRDIKADGISVFVENFGEFWVPAAAVKDVHDQKVILDRAKVGEKLLRAAAHAHDSEDPRLAG